MTSESVRRSIKAPRPLLLRQGASIYVYHIHISITINYNFDKKKYDKNTLTGYCCGDKADKNEAVE